MVTVVLILDLVTMFLSTDKKFDYRALVIVKRMAVEAASLETNQETGLG